MKNIFKFIKNNIDIIVLALILTLFLSLINDYVLPINILLSDNYSIILQACIIIVSISIGLIGNFFVPLAITKRNAEKEQNPRSFLTYYFENSNKSKYPFVITVLGSISVGLMFMVISIFLCGKAILDIKLVSILTHSWVFFFIVYAFFAIKVYNIILTLLFRNTTASLTVCNEPSTKDRIERNMLEIFLKM